MIVRESAAYLTARALPAVFNLAAIAILTRALPPTEFGQYALIISAAGVFHALLFVWMTQATFRFYAAHVTQDLKPLVSTALLSMLIFAGLGTLLGAAFIAFSQFENRWWVFAATAAFTVSLAAGDFTNTNINLEGRAGAYLRLQLSRALVNLGLAAGVAYLTGSAYLAIIAAALGQIALALAPRYARWPRHVRTSAWDKKLFRELFRYGVPLSVSFGLLLLQGFAERLVLSHLADRQAVGEFSVAYDLAQLTMGAISGALSLAFYPRIVAALENKGEIAARAELSRYGICQFGILVPAAAGLALIAPGIGRILVGEELRAGAIAAIPWMSGAMLLAGLRAYYSEFSFQLQKWTIGGPLVGLASLILNIPLNFYLVPRYGVVGAAMVSLATFALALVTSIVLGRFRGFPLPFPILEAGKILLATSAMALAIGLFRDYPWWGTPILQLFVGVSVYGTAILILNPLQLRAYVRPLLQKAVNDLRNR